MRQYSAAFAAGVYGSLGSHDYRRNDGQKCADGGDLYASVRFFLRAGENSIWRKKDPSQRETLCRFVCTADGSGAA